MFEPGNEMNFSYQNQNHDLPKAPVTRSGHAVQQPKSSQSLRKNT